MSETEIKEQLDRIERNSLLSAKNVLTVDDVSLLTGLKVNYIYKLTSANKIPYYKRGGKLNYFKRSEIEDWMLKNRIGTTDEAEQAAAKYELDHNNQIK